MCFMPGLSEGREQIPSEISSSGGSRGLRKGDIRGGHVFSLCGDMDDEEWENDSGH